MKYFYTITLFLFFSAYKLSAENKIVITNKDKNYGYSKTTSFVVTAATITGSISIASAINSTYNPPSNAVGELYYYCEITLAYQCASCASYVLALGVVGD